VSYTKKQFIEAAYKEIGFSSFDLQPDDYETALFRIDAMIAEWNSNGIRISYPLPGDPEDSVITSRTTSPDAANEAIMLNLAIRLAPRKGKVVPIETTKAATNAHRVLLLKGTQKITLQMPSTMPRGAGNKPWRSQKENFYRTPVDPVQTGSEGNLELF
jgi:hypothetical protein